MPIIKSQPDSIDSIICDWQKDGYRLPTRYEWEYAFHGGVNNFNYFWGKNWPLANTIDSQLAGMYCWWMGNTNNTTYPVATKLPNLWDLYDMIGNISEWCWSFDIDTCPRPKTDCIGDFYPMILPLSSKRVICGGAINYSFPNKSIVDRDFTYAGMGYGLRCVKLYDGSGLKQRESGNDLEYAKINIQPNPFSESVAISSGQPNFKNIGIYDIHGRKISNKQNLKFNGSALQQAIWTGRLPDGKAVSQGLYFVVLNTEKEDMVKKIIKF